jgi:UDP-GlcNAc3NAcA epimerase
MKKYKIISVIGARPQFIKHAPVSIELEKVFNTKTIHTGQHYDKKMSDVFFTELKIAKPDFLLESGGFIHGKQTGLMMIDIEHIFESEKPDGVLVYGDTNSTLAGALVASKMHIPVFHVEAGLRSYNKLMPEEINRVLSDHVSSLFFIPSENARHNLNSEGINNGIITVGDVMYDMIKIAIEKGFIKNKTDFDYYYVTLHRPYNVDEKERLTYVLQSLNKLQKKVIFAVHPRTRQRMVDFEISENSFSNIIFIDPVSYFENINYISNSAGLITDSGGMQKEAYWLRKKCITVRTETEWVETLENGWNSLVFNDLDEIQSLLYEIQGYYDPDIYGDGKASEKITNEINSFLKNKINI